MKLEQLFYFTEAIKHQSISIAAKTNFVPQSTVSTSITNLEKELGVSLLKRSNKGVKPTETGTIVAEKSREIFLLVDDIKSCVNSSENKLKINVSAMPALVDTILADLILEIEKNVQALKIDILSDEPTGVLQSVQLGLVDAGIMFEDESQQYSSQFPDLTCHSLFTDSYYLFVGQKSSLYHKESLSIKEALQSSHIAYKTEFKNKDNILTQLIKPYGMPKVVLRVDNTESMRRLIAKSEYVAFFPHFTVYNDPYIEHEKIRAIAINDANLKIRISYVESNLFKDYQGNRMFKDLLNTTLLKHYSELSK